MAKDGNFQSFCLSKSVLICVMMVFPIKHKPSLASPCREWIQVPIYNILCMDSNIII